MNDNNNRNNYDRSRDRINIFLIVNSTMANRTLRRTVMLLLVVVTVMMLMLTVMERMAYVGIMT